MKKFRFLFVLIPLLAISLFAFGQVQDSTQYPTPGSIMDIFTDLKGWFASTASVAGLSIFLTLLITKLLKIEGKVVKQVIAILVAMAAIVIGNLAGWGFMADFGVLSTIVYGLVVGFMANGLYDAKNIAKE